LSWKKTAFKFDSIRGIRDSRERSVWARFPAGPLERLFEEGIQGGFEGRGPLQTFKKE
jgi:hypothetical protein